MRNHQRKLIATLSITICMFLIFFQSPGSAESVLVGVWRGTITDKQLSLDYVVTFVNDGTGYVENVLRNTSLLLEENIPRREFSYSENNGYLHLLNPDGSYHSLEFISVGNSSAYNYYFEASDTLVIEMNGTALKLIRDETTNSITLDPVPVVINQEEIEPSPAIVVNEQSDQVFGYWYLNRFVEGGQDNLMSQSYFNSQDYIQSSELYIEGKGEDHLLMWSPSTHEVHYETIEGTYSTHVDDRKITKVTGNGRDADSITSEYFVFFGDRLYFDYDMYDREMVDPRNNFQPTTAWVASKDGLNLRTDTSTASGIVYEIPHGTQVEVKDQRDGWSAIVLYANERMNFGYVKSNYLSFLPLVDMAEASEPALFSSPVPKTETQTSPPLGPAFRQLVPWPERGARTTIPKDPTSTPGFCTMPPQVTPASSPPSSSTGPLGLWQGTLKANSQTLSMILLLREDNESYLHLTGDDRVSKSYQYHRGAVLYEDDGQALRFISSEGAVLTPKILQMGNVEDKQAIINYWRENTELCLDLGEAGVMRLHVPASDVQAKLMKTIDEDIQRAWEAVGGNYYMHDGIKTLSSRTFTARFSDKIGDKNYYIPLYVNEDLYDIKQVSIVIPDETTWLSLPEKVVGSSHYLAKTNKLYTGNTNSGAFEIIVKHNTSESARFALIKIRAEGKQAGDQPGTKVMLIRQDGTKNSHKNGPSPRGFSLYRKEESNTWLWPLPTNLTLNNGQPFGRYNSLLDFHPALDIKPFILDKAEKIVAAKDGVVVHVVSEGEKGGTACELTLRHIIGNQVYYSKYIHMKSGTIPDHIQPGTSVKQGDKLGMTGNTGKVITSRPSGGVHLHFALYLEVGNANFTDSKPDPNKHEVPELVFVLNTLPALTYPAAERSIGPQDTLGSFTYDPEGIYYKTDYSSPPPAPPLP